MRIINICFYRGGNTFYVVKQYHLQLGKKFLVSKCFDTITSTNIPEKDLHYIFIGNCTRYLQMKITGHEKLETIMKYDKTKPDPVKKMLQTLGHFDKAIMKVG